MIHTMTTQLWFFESRGRNVSASIGSAESDGACSRNHLDASLARFGTVAMSALVSTSPAGCVPKISASFVASDR